MQAVRHTADAVLRDLLRHQPDTSAKVAFAWRLAAGPALARAGRASWTDGTLHITTASDAWRREILRARPVVAERLRRVLGSGVVRTIEVSLASRADERWSP